MKGKSNQFSSPKSLRSFAKNIVNLGGTVLSYHISGPVRDRFSNEPVELEDTEIFIPEDGILGYQYLKVQSVTKDDEGNEVTTLREYSCTDNTVLWLVCDVPLKRM